MISIWDLFQLGDRRDCGGPAHSRRLFKSRCFRPPSDIGDRRTPQRKSAQKRPKEPRLAPVLGVLSVERWDCSPVLGHWRFQALASDRSRPDHECAGGYWRWGHRGRSGGGFGREGIPRNQAQRDEGRVKEGGFWSPCIPILFRGFGRGHLKATGADLIASAGERFTERTIWRRIMRHIKADPVVPISAG